MKEIFKKIWNLALPYQDKRDDEGHAEFVLKTAVELIKLENADENIVIPSAILHDIGWSKVPKEEAMNNFGNKLDDKARIELQKKHEKIGSDEIAAIVDWGEAMFGDPIYDFARVRMYIWHFDLGNTVLENYYGLVSFTLEQKQLEELYWLSRIIEYLAYYSEILNEFNTGRIKMHEDFLRNYRWKN